MNKLSAQSVIALTLVGNLSFLSAATQPIGMALANGNITVDKTSTPGNAPLFDGNTIETSKITSRLQLNNGVRVLLASDSRGKVYHDRMVLEKGATQVDTPGRYDVNASFLRVTSSDADSSARITMHGPTVQVASLKGTLQVANAQGVALTRITSGLAFDFTPQAQAAGAAMPRDHDVDENPKKKKKKANASATPTDTTGGSPGMSPMHGAHGTALIAGILIVAAVGSTVGIIATSGEAKPNQSLSPARP